MFLDLFVLFILAISTLIAFMRGFIREALTLITIGVALASTYYGGPQFLPIMNDWMGIVDGQRPDKLFDIVPMTYISVICAYGSIFLILSIAFSLFSHFLSEAVKSMGLGAIDRSLGAFFGFIRGIVLLAILYLPMHFILGEDTKDQWFSNSRGHVYLEQSAISLAKLLPQNMIESADAEQPDSTTAPDNDDTTVKPLNAREKLKSMDLLKENLDEEDRINLVKDALIPAPDNKSTGYNNDFREGLDALIEENIQRPMYNQ